MPVRDPRSARSAADILGQVRATIWRGADHALWHASPTFDWSDVDESISAAPNQAGGHPIVARRRVWLAGLPESIPAARSIVLRRPRCRMCALDARSAPARSIFRHCRRCRNR